MAGRELARGDAVVFIDSSRGLITLHTGTIADLRPHEAVCLTATPDLVPISRQRLVRAVYGHVFKPRFL
jgi:hypothetical protein